MSQVTEIELTLDEKKTYLDKIIDYKNRSLLKNIHQLWIEGIPYYAASYIDTNGSLVDFACSAYRDNSPRYGRFGLPMVDISITWDSFGTTIESASGPVYNRIKELIDYLKPACS